MPRIRVFYLDDEEELLTIFKETFETDHIEIMTFSEPEPMLRAVSDCCPDLVFLDYRLPATTGLEVAQKLPDSLPKVLITGDLNISGLTGFKAVLTKPFSMDEIQGLLEEQSKGAIKP